MSKALYGRKSEQQEKPRSGRKRGQQRGAAGHGRTQRPGLEERTEEHNPPADARVCSCCAKPYVANGERSSTVIEIEVKAHTRRIVRPRWRRNCDCASSPLEVSAPPVPRLFPNTSLRDQLLGTLHCSMHCACFRPLHRVGAWLCAQGLSVSPGTLANTLKRFVALFVRARDHRLPRRASRTTSWLWDELHRVRNLRPSFHWGLWGGMLYSGLDTYLHCAAKRHGRFTIITTHDVLDPGLKASECPRIEYPKPELGW